MKKSIDILRGARLFLIKSIEGVSIKDLNEVPAGFHNNIIWNLAHAIATQQKLCYVNAGQEPFTGNTFIEKYQSGTKPEGFMNETDFQKIKDYLLTTVDQFEKDINANIFTTYKSFELKSYPGVSVDSIQDAVQFDIFHEGLHLGYIMALKRVINMENLGQF